MQLFTDKYMPTCLDELDFNQKITDTLKKIAKYHDIPHIVFEGRRGSGKKIRALLLLKEKYGKSVMHISNHIIKCHIPNKAKDEEIELNALISPYHYQFNPSIHGVYDRVILQKFSDDIIKQNIINTAIPYRTIIIEDADLLTYEAQQALRRILETHIEKCRFIFLVNKEAHFIDALFSRCIKISVPSPTNSEISKIMNDISAKENYALPPKIAEGILEYSDRNLGRAINYLDKIIRIYPNIKEFDIMTIDDKYRIATRIIDVIISSKDLQSMDSVRSMLYSLAMSNISANETIYLLYKICVSKFHKKRGEIEIMYEISNATNNFDNNIRFGGKYMYHLEAYCLSLLKSIKEHLAKQ